MAVLRLAVALLCLVEGLRQPSVWCDGLGDVKKRGRGDDDGKTVRWRASKMVWCEDREREKWEDREMNRGKRLKVMFFYGGNWYENHFVWMWKGTKIRDCFS